MGGATPLSRDHAGTHGRGGGAGGAEEGALRGIDAPREHRAAGTTGRHGGKGRQTKTPPGVEDGEVLPEGKPRAWDLSLKVPDPLDRTLNMVQYLVPLKRTAPGTWRTQGP